MNLDEFSRQIARMVERAESLRERALDERDPHRLMYQAIAELRTSIEELRVAEEEVRDQNQVCLRVNAELERERRRYRDLFAGAPVGYVLTDARGLVMGSNEAAARLFGSEGLAPTGVPLAMFVAAADRERWRELFDHVRAGRAAGPAVLAMRTRAYDGWFRCRIQGAPERDDDDEVTGHRWILEDVTELERVHELDRLVEEGRAKDEFLAMLAHELRNPLAPIRAAVELWRQHADHLTAEQTKWTVEVVARQTDHLAHLVDDLLDVSRLSHGKIRLRRALIDLRDVVEQATEALRASALLHKLHVELPPMPVWIDGDATRLRQVAINLVENALKYTPKGRSVFVRVIDEGERAALEVRDEGVGIAPDMIEAVFGPFRQGEQTLTRSQGGLGLGLTLVRRLVELHGGEVNASSEGIGKGSRFVVQLPRAEAPDDHARACEGVAGTPLGRKILVVDDNVDAAEMLATLLETEGHSVTLAYDGAGALELFESGRPEVVLLDLGLPDVDGLEIARHIRARAPQVLLVAVTGYGDETFRARSREAGFDHHLVKPVDFDALRTVLSRPARPSA